MNHAVFFLITRHYFEQPRIIEQCHNYLLRMMRNREEKKPVVYLDKMWANAHDAKEKAWVEKHTVTRDTLGGTKRPSFLCRHCFVGTFVGSRLVSPI